MSTPELILKTFPRDPVEAIAMLYTERQDINGLSAVEVYQIYARAVREIKDYYKERRRDNNQSDISVN